MGDVGGAHVLPRQVMPLAQHVAQGRTDLRCRSLDVAWRHAPGRTFAQVGYGILQFRLGLVLGLDHPDHVAADDHECARGQDRIRHGGNDQIPGDGEADPQDRGVQRAADMPQHDHERPGRQYRREQTDDEVDRRIGRQPRILGNPVLRVLVLAVSQFDVKVVAAAQPGVDQVPADPGPPRALKGHAAPHGGHGEADADRGEQREKMRLVPDLGAVAEFEGVEEVAIPDVETVLDQQLQHRDHDQRGDQAPGEPGRRALPEVARALPEPAERVTGRDVQQAGVKHRRCAARGA